MDRNSADNPYLAALKIISFAGMGVGGLLLLFAIAGGSQHEESSKMFLTVAQTIFGLGFVVMFVWIHAEAVTWNGRDGSPAEALPGKEVRDTKQTTDTADSMRTDPSV